MKIVTNCEIKNCHDDTSTLVDWKIVKQENGVYLPKNRKNIVIVTTGEATRRITLYVNEVDNHFEKANEGSWERELFYRSYKQVNINIKPGS